MTTNNYEEIGSDLTPEAFERLKVGNILRFKNDQGVTELKIMKLNKKSKKCFVQPVKTFTPEELDGTVSVVEDDEDMAQRAQFTKDGWINGGEDAA